MALCRLSYFQVEHTYICKPTNVYRCMHGLQKKYTQRKINWSRQSHQTKLGCFFVRLSLLHTKCPVACSFLTYNFLLMSKCPLLCTIQHVLLFPSSLRTYQGFPIFPTERAMTSDPNTSLRGQRINIPCQHKWGKPLASFYSLIQSLRTVPDLPLMTLTLFTLQMESKHQQQNICSLS